MKKIFRYILAAAVSTSIFAACNMDLVPNDSIAYSSSEQLIQTQSNLTAFEDGVLASFRSFQMGVYDYVEDVMMDGFNATIDFGNNYGAVHKTDENFTSSNYDTEDTWSGAYSVIKNYNIVIANADDVKASLKANARVVKGEAFFARAYAYLVLARRFGKAYDASTAANELCVPLVLVYNQNEKPARATVAKVYESIKNDLDSAAVCLAGVAGKVRAQKPTIDAVNALYARYYLDTKNYEKAAEYAVSVINSSAKYTIAANAEAMEKEYVDEEGTEPIMQMYTTLSEGSNYCSIYTYDSTENTVESGYVYAPYYIPTKKLIDLYEADDIRLEAWYNNTNPVRISGTLHTGEFYVLSKFEGNPALTSTPIKSGRHCPKPFKIGEMYLIAAEAYFQAKNPTSAAEYLNYLQVSRGASATEATAENIQNEWFKETVGEGLRMSCLKRWGIGFSGRTCQTGASDVIQHGTYFDNKIFAADDYHFQWPVPSYEMKINKNLVQNTGYDVVK